MARRILVLNVDRDDDFGEKAGIESPIMGRRNNLKAAIALGLKDPEDSDTNSIFAAIKLYDELIDSGGDHTSIATICGHKDVGRKADRMIVEQLEHVLERTDPDGVYFVTDGAEDEAIMPIVRSRVPVDHIEKVVVRQQKNIESTMYIIYKAMQDEKIQQKFLTPLALGALIFGVFFMLNLPQIGFGALLIVIGVYLIVKIAHLEEPMHMVLSDLGIALREGRTLYLLFTFFFAILMAFWAVTTYERFLHTDSSDIFLGTVVTLRSTLDILVVALFVFVLGQTLDLWVRRGILSPRLFPRLLWLVSVFFIGMATLTILEYSIDPDRSSSLASIFTFLLLGVLSGAFAGFMQKYLKEHYTPARPRSTGWKR